MERSTKKNPEKVSTYIDDDDTTTLSYLPENVTYDVDKWSDIAKRSLTTRLYNLLSRCMYQNFSVLSEKVINYMAKCFSYYIALNSDASSVTSPKICYSSCI